MDWGQASVGDFLRGPLFGSWPGRIALGLMALPFFLGLWCWVEPAVTRQYLALAWGPALMIWPAVIFVQFVKACDSTAPGPRWEWTMVLLVALFPYVLPYLQLYVTQAW